MDTAAEKTSPAVAAGQAGHSLPAWVYRNPEFLELERKTLFMPAWHLVCHQSDIPNKGDYQTFRMLGEIVFAVRGKDGGIKAFHNVCRHRAARLLDDGKGNCGGTLTCPYHAWSYALDGRLVGVPFKNQYDALKEESYNLRPVETRLCMGFVFINLRPGNMEPEDMLAPAAPELAHYNIEQMQPLGKGRVTERRVAVNWKQGTDNYVDALHVRAAHPGLDSLVGDSYDLRDLGHGVSRLSGRIEQVAGAGLSVRAYREILPNMEYLPKDYRRSWLYFMISPSLALNLYPDCVEFMQFLPLDGTHCVVREGVYGHPDTRREVKLARYLNLRVNRQVGIEDRALISRVQDGMGSSSFTTGPLGRNEICLRRFAESLRKLIPVSRLEQEPVTGMVAGINQKMLERT
jgi:phenylpropionate dioxygenase-like ring-hydroxylating dioxygenase large terminal subunit